jgi:hypothetical protein
MPVAEIARRLDVTPSTVRDYLSDPDGRTSRARYRQEPRGVCTCCGGATAPRRGQTPAERCSRCAATARRVWSRQDVLGAYLDWWARFAVEPTSTDWNHSHAKRRGGEALARFHSRHWPTLTVVKRTFGGWAALQTSARAQRLASLDSHVAATDHLF